MLGDVLTLRFLRRGGEACSAIERKFRERFRYWKKIWSKIGEKYSISFLNQKLGNRIHYFRENEKTLKYSYLVV